MSLRLKKTGILVVVTTIIGLASSPANSGGGHGRPTEIVVTAGTNVGSSLCPWYYDGAMTMALGLLEGLYVYDARLKPVPAVAAGSAVRNRSDGSQSWTIRLRHDKRWSNGDPVTAGDFVWTWRRMADPNRPVGAKLECPLRVVKNGLRYAAGVASWEEVGIKALDDYTLVFDLPYPCSYFQEILCYSGSQPVHRTTFEKYEMGAFAPWAWVGNGPYRPVRHIPKIELEAARNRYYVGPITNVDRFIIKGAGLGMPMYESGEVQIFTDLNASDVLLARNRSDLDGHLRDTPVASVMTLKPLLSGKSSRVLGDPRVRRAMALAVPREKVAGAMLGGVVLTPANRITPTIYGLPADDLKYAPAEARHLLAEAGYPTGKSFPRLVISAPAYGFECASAQDVEQMLSAIQNEWKQILNISVDIETVEAGVFTVRRTNVDHDLTGWSLSWPGGRTLSPVEFLETMLENISFWDLDHAWLVRRDHDIEHFPEGAFQQYTYEGADGPSAHPAEIRRWTSEGRTWLDRIQIALKSEKAAGVRTRVAEELEKRRTVFAKIDAAVNNASARRALLGNRLSGESYRKRVEQLSADGQNEAAARDKAGQEQLFLLAMQQRMLAEKLYINGTAGIPPPVLPENHVVRQCYRLLEDAGRKPGENLARPLLRRIQEALDRHSYDIPLWNIKRFALVQPCIKHFGLTPINYPKVLLRWIVVEGNPVALTRPAPDSFRTSESQAPPRIRLPQPPRESGLAVWRWLAQPAATALLIILATLFSLENLRVERARLLITSGLALAAATIIIMAVPGSLSVRAVGVAVLWQMLVHLVSRRTKSHQQVFLFAERLSGILVTLLVSLILTFLLMHAAPGSFFESQLMDTGMMDQLGAANENMLQKYWESAYGTDRPVLLQLDYFLGNLLRLDIGPSFSYPTNTVQEIVIKTLPVSLQLALLAIPLGLLIGLPLGILAALKKGSWIDGLCIFIAMIGQTIPPYVTAVFLVLIFSVAARILPAGGWGSPAHYLLPVFALSLMPLSAIARYIRSSLIQTMREPYIRTARAKGGSGVQVVMGHALRNSLIPLITVLGPMLGALVIGAVWVEQIFRIPGIGQYFAQAAAARDYPLLITATVFVTFSISLMNLLVDVAYGLLDPRMRHGGEVRT